MRTTVELTSDAYGLAKAYALYHKVSLGNAISILISQPKRQCMEIKVVDGFPSVPGRRPLTPEQVKEILDEE